jgi:hypothetical protein
MIKLFFTDLTLALIVANGILLPSAYALQQKLAIDFRSPCIGAQVLGAGDPTKMTLADGITFEDPYPEAPAVWSRRYGVLKKSEDVNAPYNSVGLSREITDRAGIAGILVDDIRKPNSFTAALIWAGLDAGKHFPIGNPQTWIDDGVAITFGPGRDHQEFISFSQPVKAVDVSGNNGSFAIEGLTQSVSPKHVPDGGSTLLLLAGGLISLMTMAALSRSGKLVN